MLFYQTLSISFLNDLQLPSVIILDYYYQTFCAVYKKIINIFQVLLNCYLLLVIL